jgi:hypothetical protein
MGLRFGHGGRERAMQLGKALPIVLLALAVGCGD